MLLLCGSLALLLGSAFLALAAARQPRLSTGIGSFAALLACLLGLVPAVRALAGEPLGEILLPWPGPGGDMVLGLDRLSAFFLVPLLGLSALAAIYGRDYLLAYRHRKWLGPPAFAFNVLVASMIVVLVARSAVLFIVAWEAMTLSSYLLVSFDHGEEEVRRAGWIYLVAAHAGVTCLLAMFLLLERQAGSLELATFATMQQPSPGLAALVFGLALVGFGVKAGFVPLHVWLPEAHAAAPSHVSALMSGVLVKLGLYGLLRIMTLLAPAPWWGPVLIVLGLSGALVGIALALYQRDLKRVLAYSTVENIGLITTGLGVAYWGASRGQPNVAALGAAGALLHLWNHVLMKGLMFFAAGSVLHGSGTKDMEKLGGLLRRMPRTGTGLLVGAVAIAGLPPMNGFVSEWLVYLGLLGGGLSRGGAGSIVALLAVGLVALVGGLAALCFVRLVGVVLLGEGRSDAARHAHESSWWLVGPLLTLAAAAIGVALAPGIVISAFQGVIEQLLGLEVAAALAALAAPLATVGKVFAALWAAIIAVGLVLALLARHRSAADETWGCGYAAPSARMQYTARSFSELLGERLLPSMLGARVTAERPNALFPRAGQFASECVDPWTRSLYVPFVTRWGDRFSRLRWMQQGALHIYLLYILVILVLALGWMSWRTWVGA